MQSKSHRVNGPSKTNALWNFYCLIVLTTPFTHVRLFQYTFHQIEPNQDTKNALPKMR